MQAGESTRQTGSVTGRRHSRAGESVRNRILSHLMRNPQLALDADQIAAALGANTGTVRTTLCELRRDRAVIFRTVNDNVPGGQCYVHQAHMTD